MKLSKVNQFLATAQALAETFSKDPSTKVGAVLVDPSDFNQITEGYNGMPRGMDEGPFERHVRPLKYAFYEHAERNAIYNVVRSKLKGSIAVTTAFPSISCVRALLAVGASELVAPRPTKGCAESELASLLLSESSVQVHSADALDATVRHQRKLEQYFSYANKLAHVSCKDINPSATLFIAPQDYTRLVSGYSGVPRGGVDTLRERYLGENRDMWVESSVRNAIYNAARPLLKGCVAIVTATTCVECARGLASVGVREIFYKDPPADFKERWSASISGALAVLDELGVAHRAVGASD